MNIAARLECPPGGICNSRSVRDQVHGQFELPFEPIDLLTLKNISRPVNAHIARIDPKPPAFRRLIAGLAGVLLIGTSAAGWWWYRGGWIGQRASPVSPHSVPVKIASLRRSDEDAAIRRRVGCIATVALPGARRHSNNSGTPRQICSGPRSHRHACAGEPPPVPAHDGGGQPPHGRVHPPGNRPKWGAEMHIHVPLFLGCPFAEALEIPRDSLLFGTLVLYLQ